MSRGRTLAIRTAAACLALLLAELIVTPRIAAHPMGNFSISHYAAIRLERDGVVVRYLVDLAEIPTFQEAQDAALVAEPGHATLAPYLARQAERLKAGLRLEVDGRRRELAVVSRAIAVSPGQGGLPTLKLDMVYRAAVDARSSGAHLAYRDTNFPERVGWKEIVATAGPGVELLRSSVPATDRSGVLTDYPSDLLNSPPRVLEAEVVFSVAHPGTVTTSATPGSSAPVEATRGSRAPVGATPASVAVSPSPRPTRPPAAAAGTVATGTVAAGTVAAGATASDPIPGAIPAPAVTSIGATPRAKGDAIDSAPADDPGVLEAGRARGRRDRVTEMMGSPAHGIGVILLAALGAIAMGAFHALEPGHGKTVVAAYLVGARGTARHALLLGLTVTASHTAGVYLLGVVTLYASRYVVPERLYPWLGALSGLVIAGLGFTLFLRRYAAGAHGLDHAHVHAHAHPPDGSPAHRHVHAPVGHPHDHGHGHALDAVAHHDPHEHDHAHRHANAHAHRQEHDHATDHADAHGHGRGQGHSHHLGAGHGHHHHLPPGRAVSLRQLVALGVSGGIVPCPAALVVLLSAVALGRVGFGLFLILAFSVGLAAVLVAIGLVMVYARHLVTRLEGDGPLVTRWLPLASSAVMTVLGLAIALQAMMAADIVQIRLG